MSDRTTREIVRDLLSEQVRSQVGSKRRPNKTRNNTTLNSGSRNWGGNQKVTHQRYATEATQKVLEKVKEKKNGRRTITGEIGNPINTNVEHDPLLNNR